MAETALETVENDPRLSQLSTQWTMLTNAYDASTEEFDRVLQFQTLRYLGAVHRYFLKAVGDPEVVEELNQEFAARFLAGNFLKYDSRIGRFRDYIKRAIRNLMVDYHRRRARTRRIDSDWDALIIDDSSLESDERFIEAWRGEILDRAWNSLEELQRRTKVPYHTILKYRAQYPDQTSEQMAAGIGKILGRSLTPVAVRNRLQHAREKWVGFLIEEVKVGLQRKTRAAVEEELADLRLLHLCKPVMSRLKIEFDPE